MSSDDFENSELTQVVDRVTDWESDARVTVGDLLNRAGTRAFGPLILVIGLFGLGPTGAVPGATLLTASLLVLLALQLLAGRTSPWLPKRLLAFSFDASVITKHRNRAADLANRLGRVLDADRLSTLSGVSGARMAAVCIILLAVLSYPLAVVPLGAAAPMGVTVILGLALTTGDGLWLALGVAATAGAAITSVGLLM